MIAWIQHRAALLLVAVCIAWVTAAAAIGSAPTPQGTPTFRSTVQVNSRNTFNETAHWGGPNFVDLCFPIALSWYGCLPTPCTKDICVRIETGSMTPAQIATAIANAINNDSDLSGKGIKAKAINDSVSISSPVGPPTDGSADKPKVTGEKKPDGSPNMNRLSATYYSR